MRVESVDEVEIIRRMTEGIYDHEEFDRAMKWAKENCTIGFDKNPPELQMTEEQKEEQFEFVVKMAVIIKELMNGCDNLDPKFSEEAIGHNAIAAGFQGQRQWTDFYPNGDFAEAMLNTSFDWDGAREPYILATENDVLTEESAEKLLTDVVRSDALKDALASGDTVSSDLLADFKNKALQEDEEEDEVETLTLDQETMDDAVDTFDDDVETLEMEN